MNVDAVILAGGKSSRMGVPNKALISLAGRSLVNRVADRLVSQVDLICVSGSQDILMSLEYPIIEDRVANFSGPLAGLYSTLLYPKLTNADYLLLAPCDGPFIPENLVKELYEAVVQFDADVAVVRYEGFIQATFSLWNKRVLDSVKQALLVDQLGGFKPLLKRLKSEYLDWPKQNINPFFNINTEQDLFFAKSLLCP
jgi:molybdopterin-guanine dinucleotide biosynthesis protein A